jgi:hypothetical protein
MLALEFCINDRLTMQSDEKLELISICISTTLLASIDQLKQEWGIRNRGVIIERLLMEALANKYETSEKEDLLN